MTRSSSLLFALATLWSSTSACALFGGSDLPAKSPPLAAMSEPPALLDEPADELERAALAPGAFTGLEVTDARKSLDALLEEPEGLSVARVVENSPAAAAGITPGDVLLAVRVLPDGGEVSLAWPSQWRDVELGTAPGKELEVTLDRAGATKLARIVLVPRLEPALREAAPRLREDQRAGIVVRAATEVEARQAGLAPGAGAVIVGLSKDSPWRKELRFEDVITAVDGERVAAPDVLIEKIRGAAPSARVELDVLRRGKPVHLSLPLSHRASELREISIPLLYSYEKKRDATETSALLGLYQFERTPAAWSLRLLWLFRFSGGDADALEEVGS